MHYLEIIIGGKLCNPICLYGSPSLNMEKFEMFVKRLELNLAFIFNKNPYLTEVMASHYGANILLW